MNSSNRILIVGAALAVLFWFVDPVVDMFIAGDLDYETALLGLGPIEFYMRTTISVTFLAFAIFAHRIITKQHQSEERQKEQQHLLNTANQEMESFSYSVSHDLKVPLRHIEGFLGLLEGSHCSELSDDGKHCLMQIKNSCQRMNRLIDGLLVLSRITRENINRVPVNLSQIANNISSQLVQNEPNRNVTFNIAENIVLEADFRLIQILFENLLGNSWKFTKNRSNAVIEFGVDSLEEHDVLFVRDNGAGFNSTRSEDIFLPFKRLHSDEHYEGHGIGLSTVKRIVNRHEGRVWAQGTEGQGATIYFTFPQNDQSLQ